MPCSPPSKTAMNARMRKGAVFPTKSYITLPNGGPTARATMERPTVIIAAVLRPIHQGLAGKKRKKVM